MNITQGNESLTADTLDYTVAGTFAEEARGVTGPTSSVVAAGPSRCAKHYRADRVPLRPAEDYPIKIIAIIPARGGSKGIPRKNLALIAGKPLLTWTIQSALASQQLSRIIVSTDDAIIAQVAQEGGAEVPFMRPEVLAQDDTPGIDPIIHAIEWLAQHETYCPDYVMCLQPTTPLRTTVDIDAAIWLILQREAESLVSVTPVEHHPYWTKQITENGYLTDFLNLEHSYARRQDLPEAYALNGAIYIARRNILLTQRSWYTKATCAYVMPRDRSLDIDTPWDLHVADLILKDKVRDEHY